MHKPPPPPVAAQVGFEIRVPLPLAEIRTWSPERCAALFGGLAQAIAAIGSGGSILVQLPTNLRTLAKIDGDQLAHALESFLARQPQE